MSVGGGLRHEEVPPEGAAREAASRDGAATDGVRIRALRPPKPAVDPWKAHGVVVEDERRPDGRLERALTIFLAGAECPFTCSFCDLWRYTIDGPTPPGAIPTQIAGALSGLAGPAPDRVKLYNASNFFDRRAVPAEDIPRVAELCGSFAGVTVESHVNTIGAETLDFAHRLTGRLEVAIGLETVHPEALRRLNKRLDLKRFDAAVRLLRDHDVDVRAFVLLGAPHVPPAESVEWTVRSVEHAARAGASVVAIIPVRGGNGEMERLAQAGHFSPPALAQLEEALDASLPRTGVTVTADLWDAGRLPACPDCREARTRRLRRLNVSQRPEPRVACDSCHEGTRIMRQ